MTPNGKAQHSDAFPGLYSKIPTTKYFSELYPVLRQITASLNSRTCFSLEVECAALILFDFEKRGEITKYSVHK